MLNLEPLVARLVDDVLRLLRDANMNELREAFGRTAPEGVATVHRESSPPAPQTREPATQTPPRKARARSSGPAPAAPRPPSPVEWPSVGEITDPESLLAVVASAEAPHRARAVDKPPSEWLSDSPGAFVKHGPRLREGEAFVATKGNAVVIRRAARS